MLTRDPDDAVTLCLLAGHLRVDRRRALSTLFAPTTLTAAMPILEARPEPST